MTTFLLIAAAGFGVYWVSLWRHPYRYCRRCGGRGQHSDPAFRSAYGNCHACRDRRLIRAGVRIFTPKTYRAIQAGKHGRNY